MRIPLPALLCSILCCALLGCSVEEDRGYDVLLVGLVDVADGRYAFFNDTLSISTRLALAESTRDGMIETGGRPVRLQLLTMPMSDTPEAPRQTLYETVNTYGAQVIIGGSRSHTAFHMAQAAEELRIPFLATTATAPAVTKGKRYTFATSPSTDLQAVAYADFLHHTLGSRRLALLVEEDTFFAADFANSLSLAYAELGGRIVSTRFFSEPQHLPDRMRDIVKSEPDAILYCAIEPHAFALGHMLESLGYSGKLVGLHSRQAFTYREHLPQPNLPVYYLSGWTQANGSAINTRFVRLFREATGREPTEDDAFVHDTVLRLVDAVRSTDVLTSASLHDALLSQEEMEGAVGRYSFSPETRLAAIYSLTLLDGGLVIDQIHFSHEGGIRLKTPGAP